MLAATNTTEQAVSLAIETEIEMAEDWETKVNVATFAAWVGGVTTAFLGAAVLLIRYQRPGGDAYVKLLDGADEIHE